MTRIWGLAAALLVFVPTARAQSLGGYGGSMGMGMGASGATVIPYAGGFGGFMPYRMGGGATMSFTPRVAPAPVGPRPGFSLSPMSAMPGGSMASPSLGVGSMPTMPGPGVGGRRMGVMPPSLGYPFRQPPSLAPSTAPGMGMSM